MFALAPTTGGGPTGPPVQGPCLGDLGEQFLHLVYSGQRTGRKPWGGRTHAANTDRTACVLPALGHDIHDQDHDQPQ
jgi:hypothetical protein